MKGLTHYSNGHFRTYTERDGVDSNYFFALTEDETGDLRVRTGNRVHRWDRLTDRFVQLDRKQYPYDQPLQPPGAGFMRGMPKDFTFSTMGGKLITRFRRDGAWRAMSPGVRMALSG